MARTITQPLGFEERIRPVAEPVSTYVRPPEPAPSPLHGTAEALSRFSSSLGALVKKRDKEQSDRDKYLGQAAAMKANGVGYAEAVRQGLIGPTNSPMFIEAYKEAQGSILGKRIASGAMGAYQTWEGRNSQDPNDFDNFLGQYIKDNLTSDDPDVLKGALPYVGNISQSLYNTNTAERNDSLYKDSINAHIASSSMDIDAFDDAHLTTGGEQDYNTLWSNMMRQRELALGSGIRAEDYDAALVAMVQAKTMETMDPNLLGLLRNQVPGKDYKYSDTVDGQKVINSTYDSLRSRWSALEAEKAREQKAKDDAQKDANTAFVIEQLAENPQAIFDPEFIKQAQVLDPELPVRIKGWADTLAGNEPEDPEAILRIQEAILNGGGMEVIRAQLGPNGAIRDQATLVSLTNLAKSVGGGDMDKVMGNQAVKDSLAWIQKRFTDDMMLSIDPTSASVDAIAARTDFTNSMLAWAKANPDATYEQVSTQATIVLKRIQTSHGDAGSFEYNRPMDVQQTMETPPANIGGQPNVEQRPAQAYDPVLTPGQEQIELEEGVRRGEVEAAAGNEPYQPWRGDAAPTLESLPEDQRQRVLERARQLGDDPQELVNAMWQRRDRWLPTEANPEPLQFNEQQRLQELRDAGTQDLRTRGDQSSVSGSGSVPQDTIKQGMLERDIPEHIAEAFLMNMRDESRFNTDINEAAPLVPGSRGGYGLLQWTGPRRKALERYAKARGVSASDLNVQLDFLIEELQGSEAEAAKRIFAAQTKQEAAVAIVNYFLRPAENHRKSRAARYVKSA